MERKIIFKCKTGSHLYGTNRPESDEDYSGVFLPCEEDLFGLEQCPKEWTENVKLSNGPRNQTGDVDCKYFSLQRFINLAAQGQSQQLEMLFAPESAILISTKQWKQIINNRELFLSKRGINPFVGFALAQAHKTTLKGENLNQIRNLIKYGEKITDPELKRIGLKNHFTELEQDSVKVFGVKVKYYVNDHNFLQVRIAGRDFDINVQTKTFISSLKRLEERYGTRSEKAAEENIDYKSLGHAVRLLDETEEFLQTGKITLPRPNAEYLKTIFTGNVEKIEWFDILNNRVNNIRDNIEPNSILPDNPDYSKLNQLCIRILEEHYSEK